MCSVQKPFFSVEHLKQAAPKVCQNKTPVLWLGPDLLLGALCATVSIIYVACVFSLEFWCFSSLYQLKVCSSKQQQTCTDARTHWGGINNLRSHSENNPFGVIVCKMNQRSEKKTKHTHRKTWLLSPSFCFTRVHKPYTPHWLLDKPETNQAVKVKKEGNLPSQTHTWIIDTYKDPIFPHSAFFISSLFLYWAKLKRWMGQIFL